MSTRVIYTVLINDYDSLNDPVHSCHDIDFFCITNNRSIQSSYWNFIYVDLIDDDPVLTSRYYKFFPHILFSSYQSSIYIDASLKLISCNYDKLFSDLSSYLISSPIHPIRECIYDEIEFLKSTNDFSNRNDQFNRLIKRYVDAGFPRGFGLAEMGFIFRYHNHPNIIRLMELWWSEFKNGIRRDQLYFMFCLWKCPVNFSFSPISFRKLNKYFCHFSHKRKVSTFIYFRLLIKCFFNRIYSFF